MTTETMSPVSDRYGQVVSTSSDEAAVYYFEAVDQLLSFDSTAVTTFRSALDADPSLAVAHAGLGMSLIAEGRDAEASQAFQTARGFVEASPDLLTQRERRQIELITRPPGDLSTFDEHLEGNPGDVVVLSVAAGLLSGRRIVAGTGRDGLLRLAHSSVAAFPEDWALAGILSMELEEAWLFEEAESRALLSLRNRPDNRAACHGYVHVLHETGRMGLLEAFLSDWFESVSENSSLQTHLRWHDVMVAVENDEIDTALRRYHVAVSPKVSSRRTTLVDSAATLWRLRIDGVADLSWSPVVDLARQQLTTPGIALFDIHAALALAVGDRKSLDVLRDEWRQDRRRPHRGIVVEVMNAIAAFADDRFDEAAQTLSGVTAGLSVLGGSRLQQDVVIDTLCDALVRSGEPARAIEILRDRQRRRGSRRDARWIEDLTRHDVVVATSDQGIESLKEKEER